MMPSVLPAKRMDAGKSIYLISPNSATATVGEVSEGTVILFCNLNDTSAYDYIISICDGTVTEDISWIQDGSGHLYAVITAAATGTSVLWLADGVAYGPSIMPCPINERHLPSGRFVIRTGPIAPQSRQYPIP
jgi:hypothetical protein